MNEVWESLASLEACLQRLLERPQREHKARKAEEGSDEVEEFKRVREDGADVDGGGQFSVGASLPDGPCEPVSSDGFVTAVEERWRLEASLSTSTRLEARLVALEAKQAGTEQKKQRALLLLAALGNRRTSHYYIDADDFDAAAGGGIYEPSWHKKERKKEKDCWEAFSFYADGQGQLAPSELGEEPTEAELQDMIQDVVAEQGTFDFKGFLSCCNLFV